mmetsp:Transcript_32578/g.95355  ORF Transcript_32578/g.95355 Transcript_32578/m.95355 type:complete len:110 (+) Transcript_32578:240-569(+)
MSFSMSKARRALDEEPAAESVAADRDFRQEAALPRAAEEACEDAGAEEPGRCTAGSCAADDAEPRLLVLACVALLRVVAELTWVPTDEGASFAFTYEVWPTTRNFPNFP